MIRKEVTTFCIRNAIEVSAIIYLLIYFSSFKAISIQSLFPLFFVLLVFMFDTYKLYTFYVKQDLDELFKFQSKFLFYTFAWYFLPILVTIYFVLKNLNALKVLPLVFVVLVFGVLYFYNFTTSIKFKNKLKIS